MEGLFYLKLNLAHLLIINFTNNLYNKKIKHLARMVRAWKQKNNVLIKGLLLDTFAYSFMGQWNYNEKSFLYYDYMTRDFMKYLSEMDKSQSYWHVPGSRQYVWRIGPFEHKARQAYLTALEAISYEENNMPYTANKKWKDIFGSFFTG